MTGPDRQRVRELFEAVCDRPAEERAAYLDREAGGEVALRAEVESLLKFDGAIDDVLSEGRLGRGQLSALVDHGDDEGPVPAMIGTFSVIRRIGSGGMGTVYEARQASTQRRVALKVMRRGPGSRRLARRFEREGQIQATLNHPSIAAVYETGVDSAAGSPTPYFAMELVEGLPLVEYAARHRLDLRQRLAMVADVCDAVSYAHQRGVVHRDLKPDNVLVTQSARGPSPKILDFGVAKLTDHDLTAAATQTQAGQLLGTLSYMSPEQLSGRADEVDTRSDVYALGVILFQILTGRLPHELEGRSIPESARIIATEPPTRVGAIRPELRGDIETIISKALETEKERRYSSASELAADIRRHLDNQPISARPATAFYQLRKFASRHRGLVAGVVAAAAMLIAGVITTSSFMVRANRNAALAEANAAKSKLAQYRLSIAAADAVIGIDPILAQRRLDEAPPELRGWEWNYERARLAPWSFSATGLDRGFTPSMLAQPPGGALRGVLASRDGFDLVNLSTGRVEATLRPPAPLVDPAISPDGMLLAARVRDGDELQIWDISANSLVSSIMLPGKGPVTLLFDQASRIAINSQGRGAGVWDARTGNKLVPGSPTTASPLVASSPDGAGLALFQDAGLMMVNPASVDRFFLNCTTSGTCAAVSADGRHIAIGNGYRTLNLFDAQTGRSEGQEIRGHSGQVTAVTFSPDGRYMATSSTDGTTRVWDSASRQTIALAASGDMRSLRFSRDSDSLAMASATTLLHWRWRDSASRILRGHTGFVYFASFSPDGGQVVSGGHGDRTVRFWNASTGESLASVEVTPGGLFCLDFTRDGAHVIARTQGTMHIFETRNHHAVDLSALTIKNEFAPEDTGLTRALAPTLRGGAKGVPHPANAGQDRSTSLDGTRFVSVDRGNKTAVVFEAESGRELKSFTLATVCYSSALSPDGTVLATGDQQGDITLWNVDTGDRLGMLRGHLSTVYSICWSPDATRIASGSNDQTIRLWETASFEQVAELHGHESYVHSVSFSPDGTQIVSGGGDGDVRIWDSLTRAQRTPPRTEPARAGS